MPASRARASAGRSRGRGRSDALRPAPREASAGGHARNGPLPARVGPADPRLRRALSRASSDVGPVVIKKNGDVLPTFLVDGVVAGLWRYEDGKVKTEPFAPLPRAARWSSRTKADAWQPSSHEGAELRRRPGGPRADRSASFAHAALRVAAAVRARRHPDLGQAREPPARRRLQGSRRRQPRLAARRTSGGAG